MSCLYWSRKRCKCKHFLTNCDNISVHMDGWMETSPAEFCSSELIFVMASVHTWDSVNIFSPQVCPILLMTWTMQLTFSFIRLQATCCKFLKQYHKFPTLHPSEESLSKCWQILPLATESAWWFAWKRAKQPSNSKRFQKYYEPCRNHECNQDYPMHLIMQ